MQTAIIRAEKVEKYYAQPIVFQSFALFPWLTVMENVEAPLKARGMGAEERTRRSLAILDTVGLDGFQAAEETILQLETAVS